MSLQSQQTIHRQHNRVVKILQHLQPPAHHAVVASAANKNITSNNTSSRTKQAKQYRTYPVNSASSMSLSGKTIFVSGGSRGIGLAVALKCAELSETCNIVIASKTGAPHPKLPGTIHTAAKQIEALGCNALPIVCDIRDEAQVRHAVEQCVQHFGGIDILINNASAISITNTVHTTMKKFDLMHAVNARGTFLVTKYCIPHLKQSAKKGRNPHILTMSPPLSMDAKWFDGRIAYTMSKYGMSMCCLGWSRELKRYGIASNALWPRTGIATSAIKYVLGGDAMMRRSRNTDIMAESAYLILVQDSALFTGQFVIDEDLLRCTGMTDFAKYKMDASVKDSEMLQDGFID